MRPFATAMVCSLLYSACAAGEWQPVLVADAGQDLNDSTGWVPYRGATVTAGDTATAIRVQTRPDSLGGVFRAISPRGGFGNRVRVSLRHRVLSGEAVTVWAGPNTWNQVAAVLASPSWQQVRFEVGLPHDFPLVLHIVQPAGGGFELADLQVGARGAAPEVRRHLGPVEVTVSALEGGDLGRLFGLSGTPSGAGADRVPLRQSLGVLPAGSRLQLQGRIRAEAPQPLAAGLRRGSTVLASAPLRNAEWTELALEAVLDEDAYLQWFVAGQAPGPAAVVLNEVQALVTLPDPLGSGCIRLPEARQPITLANPDPKSIIIRPPWPGLQDMKVHLEYSNRWSYKDPDEYEATLSPDGADLRQAWRFAGDPVQYDLHWQAKGVDAVEVEVTLTNGSAETVSAFTPGFCVQTQGAYAPHTFAYTVIPVGGKPLRLDQGAPCDPTPEPWPGIGWVRAGYADSAAYRERLAQGAAWEAPPNWVREVGDFPLIARRLPGRDAWIAWTWPTAAGYFGNTQAPCMHMDPVFPDVPPGETAALRGRLWFFGGTWEQLYEQAVAARP
jgi:hypothetical protein